MLTGKNKKKPSSSSLSLYVKRHVVLFRLCFFTFYEYPVRDNNWLWRELNEELKMVKFVDVHFRVSFKRLFILEVLIDSFKT